MERKPAGNHPACNRYRAIHKRVQLVRRRYAAARVVAHAHFSSWYSLPIPPEMINSAIGVRSVFSMRVKRFGSTPLTLAWDTSSAYRSMLELHYQVCHTNAVCLSNGVCQCTAGYSGDGVTSCNLLSTTCPADNSGSSTVGFALWPSTPLLVQASGTCIEGYSGAPTRYCNMGGVWGTVANPCQRALNAAPPSRPRALTATARQRRAAPPSRTGMPRGRKRTLARLRAARACSTSRERRRVFAVSTMCGKTLAGRVSVRSACLPPCANARCDADEPPPARQRSCAPRRRTATRSGCRPTRA